jgi:hypothetical protein
VVVAVCAAARPTVPATNAIPTSRANSLFTEVLPVIG